MAENNNKVRHVLNRRSNVGNPKTINIERTTLTVNDPKAPQSTAIEYGEIAVNYGKGHEGLFIRNSENEVIQLNSIKNIRYDGSIDNSLNQYLDERYVNRSGDTIYGDITIKAQEGYDDDPKFKYEGSKFEIISDEMILDIDDAKSDITNHTYIGEKLDVTITKGENCEGNLNILSDNITTKVNCKYDLTVDGETSIDLNNNVSIDIDGNVETIISGDTTSTTYGNVTNRIEGKVDETITNNYNLIVGEGDGCDQTLSVKTNNISVSATCNSTFNINGDNYTNISGNSITNISGDVKVTYGNCDKTLELDLPKVKSKMCSYSGQVDGDVNINIDGSETKHVSGDTIHNYTTYNVNADTYNLSGTTTNMEGTTLNVDYDNIKLEATSSITLDSKVVNIYGDETNMSGITLNEYYTNINRKAITINNSASTENNYVDITNFYGDVNIEKNFHVSGDSIFEGDVNIEKNLHVSGDSIFEGDVNISGDTYIGGDLILNPDKHFDGKLKYPLKFNIATSATKNGNAELVVGSSSTISYNNSVNTTVGSNNDPLVTKAYVDDVFENILDDNKITNAIDSFKELQDVLGVTNNGEFSSTTYTTVVKGINAKVNRSGDTMTGKLSISSGGFAVTGASTLNGNVAVTGTVSASSNVSTNGKFIGNLNNTLTFNGGKFSSKTFNNSSAVTVNVPTDISHLTMSGSPSDWGVLDDRYVNVSGDTMSGKLSINSGGFAVTGASTFSGTVSASSNVSTNGKFIGNLNNTLTFNGGSFSAKTFNNSSAVIVNVPTDISHLTITGSPSDWGVLDDRYVNVTGDTMSGNLKVGTGTTNVVISTNGTVTSTGAIYSSDKKLKKDIKSINNNDIKAVSKVDLKSYKFIYDETNRERYGVIAQDLESVGLEHLVIEQNDKKGVDYISFLILKIAELEKRIEELENK